MIMLQRHELDYLMSPGCILFVARGNIILIKLPFNFAVLLFYILSLFLIAAD